MIIDRCKIYIVGNYTFKNFINLSEQELMMVLEWRNNEAIRKWMTNTEPISLENHLKFVGSLSHRDDLYYWVVFKDDLPVGVVDIFSINRNEDSAETGYYLNPEYLDSGAGFEFYYYFKLFIHDSLDIKITRGLMQKKNIKSFMLITYFGGKVINVKTVDGDDYFLMETNKKDFEKIKGSANDILRFAKYIRSNKIDLNSLYKEKILNK
jgi:UDP-4-amino-4,6-dideoxy-N-acetyl-beta-L-altrosamine N-acetyltransferase